MTRAALGIAILTASLVVLASAAEAPAVAPKPFVEAMLSARSAPKTGDGFTPFVSQVIRGETAAQRISVDVSAVQDLWLVNTHAGDGNDRDLCVWGEPVLIARDGKKAPLTGAPLVREQHPGHYLQFNKARDNKPLVIGEQTFATGILGAGRGAAALSAG